MERIRIIANPVAGNRAVSRKWQRTKRQLQAVLGDDLDCELTIGPGDAETIARQAIGDGIDTIVAVGGDGTIHEVVNGLFEDGSQINPAARLAIVAMGTGGDFARSLPLRCKVKEMAQRIAEGRTQACDLGQLSCVDLAGKRRSRYFINVAEAGFGAQVVAKLLNSGKLRGATTTYLVGALRTLVTYKNSRIGIRVDDAFDQERIVNSVLVANGRFLGGGMKIAPRANLQDARFEVIIIGDISPREALISMARLYRGSLDRHSKVTTLSGKNIRLEADTGVLLEADGELLGKLPATFRVLPRVLNVIA